MKTTYYGIREKGEYVPEIQRERMTLKQAGALREQFIFSDRRAIEIVRITVESVTNGDLVRCPKKNCILGACFHNRPHEFSLDCERVGNCPGCTPVGKNRKEK